MSNQTLFRDGQVLAAVPAGAVENQHAWARGATVRAISRSWKFIASVLQGRIERLPDGESGQTAPKMYAHLYRVSRTARGRVPRFAQTRVSVPFWPTRPRPGTRSRAACRAPSGMASAYRRGEAL